VTDIPVARPSSTVILARDVDGVAEIFMVRRHEKSSFGDSYAFPGGVVDAEDAAVRSHCEGVSEEQANQHLGVGDGGIDYYSAAIRELFEETGVLLADVSAVDENLQSVRDGLNDGSVSWADFVRQNALQLRCDELHYVSHWITPEQLPKRYSTRFFVAALPAGQSAMHCGGELTESCWSTARETLEAGRRGDAKLHFPTTKTLESVARHQSFDELLEWAASSVTWGITSMVPVIIERHGCEEIVLPGDKDYPGAKS
jgi:8-oxo-dGTP pyrophosphatase MutT (NUDIX family)